VTVFTASNPGIDAGGFVGESKIDILQALRDPGRVAPTAILDAARPITERIALVRRFMSARALSWPIVVKPNVGQRGSGVAIVHNERALADRLARTGVDLMVQPYVAGLEFGLFYARRPDDARGRLISITEKRLPAVIADGRRTLESLILDDPRAVAMARVYCERFNSRLHETLPAGTRVPLVDVGTHCRGAVFLDGREAATPALEHAVETLSRTFDGFYFGRFDVRTPSLEALHLGIFTVLELNGVTSEMTHIYDPAFGVLRAWHTICAQWTLAFEIGAANHAAGAPVASIGDLIRRLRAYRRTAAQHPPGSLIAGAARSLAAET
jgi:hypothetical protein